MGAATTENHFVHKGSSIVTNLAAATVTRGRFMP
jgi:hypothetical protein